MREGKRLIYTPKTGYLYGKLAIGCIQCMLGGKIVVFITGLCNDNCWYCPVSKSKFGRDIVFVDENRVNNLYDIVDEAYKIRALGAGITGGDPVIVADRTCNVISLLKQEFGEKFHIHLYTSGRFIDRNKIESLVSCGLDEIRFHVYTLELLKKVKLAREYSGIKVGIEVPFIPLKQYTDYLKQLLKIVDEKKLVDFVNINEFEVSETNIEEVLLYGLKPKGLTVEDTILYLPSFVKWVIENIKNIDFHFCTLWYKDNVQYRYRMLRKSIEMLGVHEVLTREGTLISIVAEKKFSVKEGLSKHFIVVDKEFYINPYRAWLLKGSGIRAIVKEYYPEGNILNQRNIIY